MPSLHMSIAALSAILFATHAPKPFVLLFFMAGGILLFNVHLNTRMWMTGTFLLFFMAASIYESRHESAFTGLETEWTVSFKEDLRIDGDRLNTDVVEVSSKEALKLTYRFQSKEEKELLNEKLVPGLTCRIQAEAALPNEARNPGEFNYRSYLAADETFFVLTPKEISLEQCVMNRSLRYLPAAWRISALSRIKESFPAPLSSVAAALLFGDRSSGSEEVDEDYERLGIVHILSISGLHVTLLTGLVFYVLIRVGITRERTRLVLLAVLPLYALLAGASPPVIRACLMTGAILFAASSNIKLRASSALGIAFLIMTLVHPYSVFQAGFQLSFLVTFALVLSSGVILKRARNAIELSWFVSILSQLAALPVLLVHFAELSIIAPLANLIFVPFYSLLMLPSLLLLFFLSFFVPIAFFAGLANVLLIKMDKLASIMADAPFAVLVTGQPNMKTAVILTILSIGSLLLWEITKRIKSSLIICSLLLAGLIVSNRYSSEGEVTFLDVGQGDSIFIKLPYNQGTYLIDTGGQMPFEKEKWTERQGGFSVGKDTIVPFLKRKGITKLDKLIITHADFDHAGAAAEVLEKIPAKEILISPGSGEVDVMAGIIRTGIKVREGAEGESWQAGDAFFQFLAPNDREYEGNDDSLVLYAKIGGKTWLFNGDLEEEGEKKLVKQYNLDIDWLKVGHHGSKTSSSVPFIKAVNPEFAVISAGVNNRYGHPHKEVTDTLAKEGVKVYRTDKQGAITFKFDGEKSEIKTVIRSK
ncbi:DNA internalization-related competence protein ComEC/Rec2 [Domibacillus iocasae]|uniref:DNA internalization-related competence protein ComEC/Rec2 n=1 Tax=Domibacillus iocasae TaxID=1714016 RepID=A0A1E7DML0_9BACI|nr:DNA internalization-related competence protein ComEC/Rec2 [Domibacillus iocasae]OES44311.1 DNA internalization-related competence protein ComEC/Rec2 [Domibacillus iocasae]